MDVEPPKPSDPEARERLRAWLACRPGEAVGLSVMLAGAIAASLLVFTTRVEADPPSVRAGPPASAWDAERGHTHGQDAHLHADPRATTFDGVAKQALTVHVSGAVRQPGIVRVPVGARVADVIATAGGAGWSADLDAVNLARPVVDGEHVRLPYRGEHELASAHAPASAVAGAAMAGPHSGRVDINRATVSELTTLPGIGPTRAAAIVDHRQRHGPFRAPGDLRAVSGIGEATFQNLAEHVSVG
jgi:competence protein ComEA